MPSDVFGILGTVLTGFIVIAGFLQGIVAAFDLLDRWKAHRSKRNNRDNGPSETNDKSQSRVRFPRWQLTQETVRKVFLLVPYYLFAPAMIYNLYNFYQPFGFGTTIAFLALYTYFYLAHPFLMWKTNDTGCRKFLQVAMGCLCLLWFIASISNASEEIRTATWYPFLASVSHGVIYTLVRFSLLHYIAIEIVRPWIKSLPEN